MLGTLKKWVDRTPTLIVLIITVLGFWGAYAALADYLDRPEVHISYLTQECVRVVNADGSPGSCEALPDRYERVWVE